MTSSSLSPTLLSPDRSDQLPASPISVLSCPPSPSPSSPPSQPPSSPVSPAPPSLTSGTSARESCSTSYSLSVSECSDVGLLLKTMPQSAIQNLPTSAKYSLLQNHFRPSEKFKFPSRQLDDGCRKACKFSYLTGNPWFVYSKSEDGLFCLPCILFARKDHLGQFVSSKFNHWTK